MRSVTLCGAVAILLWGCSSGSDSPGGSGAGQAGSPAVGGNAGATTAGTSTQAGDSAAPGSGAMSQGGSAGMSQSGGSSFSSGSSGSSATAGSGGVPAGGGGSGGSGGSSSCAGTPTPAPVLTSCPAPAGSTPQDTALATVNNLRAHMGLSCMALVPAITTSSQKHCDYYQQNLANKDCIANAHEEVATCAGYVDQQFYNRMTKAGYTGSPRSEVMAFSGNPQEAIAQWINSVYHRTPLLSPWIGEMGYGMTADCDTIDMGQGPKLADDITAQYPYPGQTDIPLSFDGSREGPMPPEPPTPPNKTSGWPSASPIHLYAKNYTVTSHDVYAGSSCDSLPHQWLPDKEQYILYPNVPFAKGTVYRVVIKGTRAGQELDFDWTFTTKN